jgi:hypothetical protein
MAVSIEINGSAVSEVKVPLGVAVSLTNNDNTGIGVLTWEIVAYPERYSETDPDAAPTQPAFATNYSGWTLGVDSVLSRTQTSGGGFSAVPFTPDLPGRYEIRLTSDIDADPVTVVTEVTGPQDDREAPAPGENAETGTFRGWARNMNRRIEMERVRRGWERVYNGTGSTIAVGKVVRITGTPDWRTLSGNSVPAGAATARKRIPQIALEDGTARGAGENRHGIVAASIVSGAFGWIKSDAAIHEGDFSTYAVGDKVYADATGSMSPTPSNVAIGFVTVASATGAMFVHAGISDQESDGDADWALNKVRYYLIDPVAGNDSRIGYYDGDPLEVLNAATMTSLALKTYEEFYERVPKQGAGRRLVCLIKGDASASVPIVAYKKDAVTVDDINVDGLSGYQIFHVRASDFTNGANDKTDFAGYKPAAGYGPNGDNSWTVGSWNSTLSQITVASGTVATDLTLVGMKLRFKGNVTAGLRTNISGVKAGQTSAIMETTGSTSTPAAGDEFFLELPSVQFRGVKGKPDVNWNRGNTASRYGIQIIGLDIKIPSPIGIEIGRSFDIGNGAFRFCRFDIPSGGGPFIFNSSGALGWPTSWIDEGFVAKGFRHSFVAHFADTSEAIALFSNGSETGDHQLPYVFCKGRLQLSSFKGYGTLLQSSAVHGRLTVYDAAHLGIFGGQSVATRLLLRGESAATLPCAETRDCANIHFQYVVVGPYGTGGIQVSRDALFGTGSQVRVDNITGTVAAGYGVVCEDVSSSGGSIAGKLIVGTGNTATGPSGDVRIVGSTKTWAQVAAQEYWDNAGNRTVPAGVTQTIRRIVADTWLRLPTVTSDPSAAELPPAGSVDTWLNSTAGTEQISIRDSASNVFRVPMMGTGGANRIAYFGNGSRLDSSANFTFDGNLVSLTSAPTVASAGGATWNGMSVGGTLTLTGTTLTNALSLVSIAAPTITAGSAVTVTDAATLNIAGAPVAAGSAVLTNSWAAFISGDVRLNNSLKVGTFGGAGGSAPLQALDVRGHMIINGNGTEGFIYRPNNSGVAVILTDALVTVSDALAITTGGSLSAAALRIAGTTNNGLFGTATTVSVTVAGTHNATFSTTALYLQGAVRYRGGGGAANDPLYQFTGTAGLGLYAVDNDNTGLSSNNTLRLEVGIGGTVVRSGTRASATGSGLFMEYGGTVADTAMITALSVGTSFRALALEAASYSFRSGVGSVAERVTIEGSGLAVRSGQIAGGSGSGLFLGYDLDVANTSKIVSISQGVAYRALQVDAVSIDLRIGTDRGLFVDSNRNVVPHSGALATNAADGYVYVTSFPGTPTGGTTSYTGRCQIGVDSTNNLFYFKNGGTWYAAGGVGGSGTANRVAYWTATASIGSSSVFTFDGTTLGLDGPMNFLDSANPSAPSNGISLFSKANNLVSRDTDDCYHSVVPIGPSAGSATVHWEKWFRVTSAGTSTTFDISLTSLNGVNTQVNNGIFWIEVIWLNMQSTTYVFTRQRRACYRWDNTTSTIEEMAESSLETLQLGAAGGDMTFAVSGTSDVRVTLSTSVSDQIDGRCFARVLFADPA